MPRERAYCDTCESTVYADAVHSCYDAKALRAVRDAEAAVVEAAEREYATANGTCDDYTDTQRMESAQQLHAAVRALHAARGHSPQDAESITRQGVQDA